jgi:cell division control protein 12
MSLTEQPNDVQAAMPFSIIGSTTDVTAKDGRVVKGREYLWGVAEGERIRRFRLFRLAV